MVEDCSNSCFIESGFEKRVDGQFALGLDTAG
jgi:hypothetical protein